MYDVEKFSNSMEQSLRASKSLS